MNFNITPTASHIGKDRVQTIIQIDASLVNRDPNILRSSD
jgi:hypothetical protein